MNWMSERTKGKDRDAQPQLKALKNLGIIKPLESIMELWKASHGRIWSPFCKQDNWLGWRVVTEEESDPLWGVRDLRREPCNTTSSRNTFLLREVFSVLNEKWWKRDQSTSDIIEKHSVSPGSFLPKQQAVTDVLKHILCILYRLQKSKLKRLVLKLGNKI